MTYKDVLKKHLSDEWRFIQDGGIRFTTDEYLDLWDSRIVDIADHNYTELINGIIYKSKTKTTLESFILSNLMFGFDDSDKRKKFTTASIILDSCNILMPDFTILKNEPKESELYRGFQTVDNVQSVILFAYHHMQTPENMMLRAHKYYDSDINSVYIINALEKSVAKYSDFNRSSSITSKTPNKLHINENDPVINIEDVEFKRADFFSEYS